MLTRVIEPASKLQWDAKVFDLQVANHKLLGHGSVKSWYKPGEIYGSKFGVAAGSIEILKVTFSTPLSLSSYLVDISTPSFLGRSLVMKMCRILRLFNSCFLIDWRMDGPI
ncbi:hypothetical protein KEM48_010364 [Puccinia striiformis f. sp. tritici PST-130]|nr:hypothetical protein KEM48_010364 [Puccinia striiformis f. sp. tritici PST-130]